MLGTFWFGERQRKTERTSASRKWYLAHSYQAPLHSTPIELVSKSAVSKLKTCPAMTKLQSAQEMHTVNGQIPRIGITEYQDSRPQALKTQNYSSSLESICIYLNALETVLFQVVKSIPMPSSNVISRV